MKKILAAVLLLMVFASPAFAVASIITTTTTTTIITTITITPRTELPAPKQHCRRGRSASARLAFPCSRMLVRFVP